MIIFRYREERSKILGKIRRPVAEVKILSLKGKWVEFHPYIDSGADITLIPYTLGLYIGFKSPSQIVELYGAGSMGVPVEIRRVKMRIGNVDLEPRVAWALIEETPPLLGRSEIFDKFNITFKEEEGIVVFEPIKQMGSW